MKRLHQIQPAIATSQSLRRPLCIQLESVEPEVKLGSSSYKVHLHVATMEYLIRQLSSLCVVSSSGKRTF